MNRIPKVLRAVVGALGVITTFAISTGYAQRPLPTRLAGTFHGEAAIAALGVHLPAVAQAHRMRPDELHMLFRTQRNLAVDPDGELLYVCDAPVAPQEGETASTTYVSAENTSTSGDPFKLHSFPGAPKVIYLDFNGHTTSGTQWNTSFTGGASIYSKPFDLDGSPTTWSAAELDVIRKVWQRVAEDYAPFAVDVTTEDPGLEALRRTTSTDLAYGVRVVISPTNWYNTGAGGVGYLGSFSASSDTPCFAFTAQLGNSEGPIAETAAHEAGHTLGLYHDGSSTTEYYAGQGNWAPIMGNSFYKTVTQFSRGEYSSANNKQDDFAVIATYVPYAGDDHGNTLTSATALSGTSVSDGGTIERSTDLDVFKFTCGSGTVSLAVRGPSLRPNLDVQAELLHSDGRVLQTSNPTTLDAAINASVSAGTYYLRVRGVGAGDPLTTGYSNYGSVGNYVITGTLPSGTTTSTVAPAFTTQPVSQSVNAGANVTFTASASGSPTPTYQWLKDGVSMAGATSTTLTLNAVTTSNAGSYSVIATNSAGSVTSSTALLSVNATSTSSIAPAITKQPVSQVAAWGSTVYFTVEVTGSPAPTVRWYRNGITFSSWTGTTFPRIYVTSNDNGTYTAVVTNSAGSVTSAPATLIVTTSTSTSVAPAFTTQPVNQTVNAGANVTFTSVASGSPAPTYQWRKDGAPIAGATGSTLALSAVTTASAGSYSVVATNSAGSAISAAALLTVNAVSTSSSAPTITLQPVSQTATWGTSVSFTVGVAGSPTPSVRWYRNGLTWDPWTGTTLTLRSVTTNDNGTYVAVVTNSAGSVTSASVTLKVQ